MGSTPLLLSEGNCLPHGKKEEYPCATCEHTIDIVENIPPAGPEGEAVIRSGATTQDNTLAYCMRIGSP